MKALRMAQPLLLLLLLLLLPGLQTGEAWMRSVV